MNQLDRSTVGIMPASDSVFTACLTAVPGDVLRFRLSASSMSITFIPARRKVAA